MKYVFIFTVLFISCTYTNNTPTDIIVLTDNISEEISLNELFGEFEYISLETSEKSIFGAINKLIVDDNKYYILDRRTKKIFVFQADGTFVQTIGKLGKGPGEYTHLEDFVIDKENNRIIILGFPSIVYVYDLDGNYILQKQIMSSPVWSICSYKDGFICSNNHQSLTQENALIYLFDKDFNLKNEIGKVLPKNTLPPFISHPFFKDVNDIAYFDNFNSTIYLIDTTNLDNSGSISFVLRDPIPLEALSDAQKFIANQNNYSFFTNAYLANNILWASFVNHGELCVLVRDLKNQKQVTAKYNNWYPTIMSSTNGYFYAAMNVDWILGQEPAITSAKRITQYPIDYDSNPVIVRFKPKQIFK